MVQLFLKQWFLIALLLVLVLGMWRAPELSAIAEQDAVRDAAAALVLFLLAWPLEFRTMWQSLSRPGPPLLAVAISFGILPCFAWGTSLLLSEEMAPGLLVAAVAPSTLASAAVWTRRAGGNDAVAVLVTIITNSICFLVTPLWLLILTGQRVNAPELSLTRMTGHLSLLVVLPMVLAQLTRWLPAIRNWTTRQKVLLSGLAQCGIFYMVFLGAIQTGLRLRETAGQPPLVWDLCSMLPAVLVVHLAMFWTGIRLASWLRFSPEDQIAVGFAGSQKTLMVGLVVAMSLEITILPMVSYHVLQLLADTVIADRYRRYQRLSG
jgi:sodium/bile acid cotransporter 7